MENDNKTGKAKEPKKKPLYSLWQNMRYIIANIWKWDKLLLFFSSARVPFMVVQPLLGIYLSSYVVKMVTDSYEPFKIAIYIALISAGILLITMLNTVLNSKIATHSLLNRMRYIGVVSEKAMDTDYENTESANGQDKFQKAWGPLNSNNSAGEAIINNCVCLIANFFGLISYAAILATLNPLIIVIVVITSVAGYFISKPYNIWEFRNRDKWTPIDRKMNYLWQRSSDFGSAKDIRLYNMSGWFSFIFDKTVGERNIWHKKSANRWFATDFARWTLDFIRNFAAYGFLVYLLFTNNMPVDNFVLYFGVIGGFSSWLGWLIGEWTALNRNSLSMCDLRGAVDMPDKFNKGKGISIPTDTCMIEFKNVSFGYTPEEKIIKNLSFKIQKGEKVAIVGPNGAGKTTLIKLLCGFYTPDEGEVLVNGKNIKEYNLDEYYTLFAAVFQDINFLPVKIKQNITCSAEDTNNTEKMEKVIELSGLKSKIDSLPDGINSQMGKSIYDDAIELSGGETQKLALARALYKGGRMLVLDEPTAALDPIAESALYEQYNDMSGGKTSIFISHRLASAKFCSRIFYIDKGEITEMGSHEELMAKGGKYSEMFEIQSHYYKENIKDSSIILEGGETV